MRPQSIPRSTIGRALSSRSGAAPSPTEHCAKLVRQGDYDGYIFSFLDKVPQRRSAALAVRAFNIETASVRDAVRGNAMAGELRMQWWKDSLAAIFDGNPPPQPIAIALSQAVERHKLTKRWFDRLLDARIADLHNPQLSSIKAMETYAENTASSLLYLMLEIAGVKGKDLDHAAAHVGKAVGIVTLLRGAPHQLGQEHSVIPSEVLWKHRLYSSVLRKGPKTPEEAHGIAECFYDVSAVSKGHLDAAQEVVQGLSADAFHALLPGVRAAWYLEKLEACRFDAFDERLQPHSPLGFHLRLAKSIFTQKF